MVKAVLFDLDGTLLDTIADIHNTLNGSLQAFGYAPVTRKQTEQFVGNGAEKLVQRAVGDQGAWEEVYAHFHARYAVCDNSLTDPYEGEVAYLERLQRQGVLLGVVTNKPHAAAVKVLADRLPTVKFDFVAGDSGNFPVKPDPTLARYAALSMRVAPCECAFVGDGETDVLTAIRAGMKGIACLWGYRSREQLEEAGATRFASSYAELAKILAE